MSEAGTDASTVRLRIPPGKQRIEFRYNRLILVAPHKVRFSCTRLEGLDRIGWRREPSGRRFIVTSNPGITRFT